MKCLHVVGNRPQFVKCAALLSAGQKKGIQQRLVHTGQHFDSNMSDIFFNQMKIRVPDFHFQFGNLSHGAMTGRMLESLERVISEEKPNFVIVYGDTNTTLAASLAAVKLSMSLVHIESGLRSFNRRMPEEINRILTDQCADFLFTPTENSTNQLLKEGFESSRIFQVGDVMYDTFLTFVKMAPEKIPFIDMSLPYILVTIHRAGNTDDPKKLREIIEGLKKISQEMRVIFPLHPRTKDRLNKYQIDCSGIEIIDPVGYLEMITLERNASLIITDSGGVPKEAYFLKVPCLIVRNETEWVELVESGFSTLVSAKSNDIFSKYRKTLSQEINWSVQLYGKGDAAQKIIKKLQYH